MNSPCSHTYSYIKKVRAGVNSKKLLSIHSFLYGIFDFIVIAYQILCKFKLIFHCENKNYRFLLIRFIYRQGKSQEVADSGEFKQNVVNSLNIMFLS